MTYSDMVTLLLVFFVVIYMLTPGVDYELLQDFLRRFQGGPGILQQQESVMDRRAQEEEMISSQTIERWQALIDIIEERELEESVTVDLIAEGVRITMSESVTFNSGSSELIPQAQAILIEVADLFDDDIYETEVQGHTDNVPLRESAYYRSNWDLGAARAVSVVHFINNLSDLPPETFKASSYGEYRPVASNNTEEGRRANRRIEIYIKYDDNIIDMSDQIPGWRQGLE